MRMDRRTDETYYVQLDRQGVPKMLSKSCDKKGV